MMQARAGGFAAVAIGPPGWCAVLGGLVGGDPMVAIEVAVAGLGVLWVWFVLMDLFEGRRHARDLAVGAQEISLFGVRCRVTAALGMEALVVGALWPGIYLGSQLLATLTDDELEAVVYHEDHHRRSRAPLRAVALAAWLRLLGRHGAVRGVVLDRLADLETLADADAIRRGSSPRSLARALLKGDPSLQPAAFSYGGDRRIERLLDRAAGRPASGTLRLPYEWLPIVLITGVVFGCHAVL